MRTLSPVNNGRRELFATDRSLERQTKWKVNEERRRSQPCAKGWMRKDDHFSFLAVLFASSRDWFLPKVADVFLALRKDLSLGMLNRRRRNCVSRFFKQKLCSKVLDFHRSDTRMCSQVH